MPFVFGLTLLFILDNFRFNHLHILLLIVFGICCWISEKSQLPELRRCLESVKDYRVILVDGKWYDVDGDCSTSIPEARDLISQYPNVTVIDYPNHHEWESRNKYLQACNGDDILIVLDTDEFISGTLEGFTPDNNSFPVTGFSKRHGGKTILNRGIRSPFFTRHKDRHNEYWLGDTKLDFSGSAPPNFIIHEDKFYRSDDIEKTMKKRNSLRPFR